MNQQSGPDGVFTILFVCSGNVCRSPLAQQLGQAYVDQALGDDAGRLVLASAGTQAVVGSAMDPDSAQVLRDLGGEPDGFHARQLWPADLAAADLVLTMTREHRRIVLELAPRGLSRTFTLREAAAVLGGLPRNEWPGPDVPSAARRLVSDLAKARHRRPSGDDDVVDPVGRPLEVHRRAGELIAESLSPLLARLVAPRAAA